MRETERRIQKYTARLPKVREKVMASLVLFVVATSMLTVATFSWITLSRAPEVSGIPTTIAANGNLEIALVPPDGSEPAPSEVGDSWLDLFSRNIKWGNLVNLSDPAYGLEKIVLRPAELNPNELASSPLTAVSYTADGRVESTSSDFKYTVYENGAFVKSTKMGIRAISSVAVGDINSGEDTDVTTENEYTKALKKAKKDISKHRSLFNNLSTQMDGISGLIGSYMNGILRETNDNESCAPKDVFALYELMLSMDTNVIDPMGETLMMLYVDVLQTSTIRLNATNADGSPAYTPTAFTDVDDFCNKVTADLVKINAARKLKNEEAVKLDILSKYITSRNTLKTNIAALREEAEIYRTTRQGLNKTWGDIKDIANSMVNIGSVTLNDKTMSQWLGNISLSSLDTLLAILDAPADQNNVTIEAGLLKDVDAMLHNGKGFHVSSITIQFDMEALKTKADKTVSGGGSMVGMAVKDNKVSANIRTGAVTEKPVSYADEALERLGREDITGEDAGVSETLRDFIAQETYGLVLDFWLRTNNNGSYLLLEGEEVKETVEIKEMVSYQVTNASGNVITNTDGTPKTKVEEVTLYDAILETIDVIVYNDESRDTEIAAPIESEAEVFRIDTEDGRTVWYQKTGEVINLSENGVRGGEVTENGEPVGYKYTVIRFKEDPVPKTKTTVTGYTGVNRVWTDETLETKDYNADISTTQGAGSCYIFYADKLEEIQQSLNLIAALKVAFVEVVNETTINLLATAEFDVDNAIRQLDLVTVPMRLNSQASTVTTDTGELLRVIAPLKKNEAMRVSVIVYLDGDMVSNDTVLSASEINGTMNIQFGSYTRPEAMNDNDLVVETRELKVALDGEYEFTGYESERPVNIKLTVTGDAPKSILAYFTQKINNNNGCRYPVPIQFTDEDGDGTWIGTINLMGHGTFVLHTVIVDGVNYSLKSNEQITVVVPGFGVDSCYGQKPAQYTYRTAEDYVTERFTIVLSADGDLPGSVQGIFNTPTGSTITTTYVRQSGNIYAADVTFTESATYTMENVLIDGQYCAVAPIEREIYCGLYAVVKLDILNEEGYTAEENKTLTTAGLSYFYKGIPHEFNVSVEIYDSKDNLITDLGTIGLQYGNQYAQLQWNKTTQCYDGRQFLINSVGVYSFRHVEIFSSDGGDSQYITEALAAMAIRVLSDDPIQYLGVDGEIETSVMALSAGSNAEITLAFENAGAASVYGLFAQSKSAVQTLDGEASSDVTYWILLAENNNDDTHTFVLPRQDGYWQLLDIKISTVFNGREDGVNTKDAFYQGDPDNTIWPTMDKPSAVAVTADELQAKWYECDEPKDTETDYYYDVPAFDVPTVKVIAQLHITTNVLSSNTALAEKSGGVLQKYTFEDLYYQVLDFEKQPLSDQPLTMHFELDSQSISRCSGGAYSYSGNMTFNLENVTATSSRVDGDLSLFIAGEYKPVVTFYVGDTAHTVRGNALISGMSTAMLSSLKITSQKPDLKVTAVSPAVGTSYTTMVTADETYGVSSYLSSDGYMVTTYLSAEYVTSLYIFSRWQVSCPTISLSLTGLTADYSSASFTIPNNSNTQQANTVSFSSGATTKSGVSVGYVKNNTGDDTPYPAGKQTIKQISVTAHDQTFAVTLAHDVIINQPARPPQATFANIKGIESSFPGSTPAAQVIPNGLSMELELPYAAPSSWVKHMIVVEGDEDAFVQQGDPVVLDNGYTTQTGGCNDTYTHYNLVQTTYTATASTIEYDITYRIVGWKVGDTVYEMGDVVTISGDQTIFAVIESTEGPRTTAVKTITRRVLNYVQTASGQSSTKGSDWNNVDMSEQVFEETSTN